MIWPEEPKSDLQSIEEAKDKHQKAKTVRERMRQYNKKVLDERMRKTKNLKPVKIGDVVLISQGIGTVRYVGPVHCRPKEDEYIGVELNKPKGKNNGTIMGKTYFICPPKFGLFVKSSRRKPVPKNHKMKELMEKISRLTNKDEEEFDFIPHDLFMGELDNNTPQVSQPGSPKRNRSIEPIIKVSEPPSPAASIISLASVISVSTFCSDGPQCEENSDEFIVIGTRESDPKLTNL